MHRDFRTHILRNQRVSLLLTEQPFTPRQQHNTTKISPVVLSYYCGKYKKRNCSKVCICTLKHLQRTLKSRLAVITSSFQFYSPTKCFSKISLRASYLNFNTPVFSEELTEYIRSFSRTKLGFAYKYTGFCSDYCHRIFRVHTINLLKTVEWGNLEHFNNKFLYAAYHIWLKKIRCSIWYQFSLLPKSCFLNIHRNVIVLKRLSIRGKKGNLGSKLKHHLSLSLVCNCFLTVRAYTHYSKASVSLHLLRWKLSQYFEGWDINFHKVI